MIQNPECQVETLDPAGNGMLLKVLELHCGTTCSRATVVGQCSDTWWSRMAQCLEGAEDWKETSTRGANTLDPPIFPCREYTCVFSRRDDLAQPPSISSRILATSDDGIWELEPFWLWSIANPNLCSSQRRPAKAQGCALLLDSFCIQISMCYRPRTHNLESTWIFLPLLSQSTRSRETFCPCPRVSHIT